MKLKKTDGFRSAFAKAKKEGKKTFMWNGKSYTTQTAEEKALKMSDKELADAREQSFRSGKAAGMTEEVLNTDKAKSTSEIFNSYLNEYLYRLGDKKKKMRSEGKIPDFEAASYARPRPSRLKK